ncbi:MAG: hypothetical protein AAF497_03345, partial [Planctomycetota bacterium]
VNGGFQDRLTHTSTWEQVCVNVPAGVSTLRWEFRKDSFGWLYEDSVWLDEVSFQHTGPDTDGDGLPDAYETAIYGSNPNAVDTDGDGVSDGEEVAAGLNPVVVEVPENHTPTMIGGLYCVQWTGLTGIKYQVQRSFDLVTWENAPSGIPLDQKSSQFAVVNGTLTYCDPLTSTYTQPVMYRVIRVP